MASAGVAARSAAWVVSDEIYRGAEMDGVETPTMWGRYDRAIVTSGLSKAYGLPGLRIGWVAGPPDVVEQCWAVHDYTSIAPGAINDRLARVALRPPAAPCCSREHEASSARTTRSSVAGLRSARRNSNTHRLKRVPW